LLSRRIDELASHLKKNPKDNHSRRGLLQMVSDRRAHMKYLEGKNVRRYNALTKKLGLKKYLQKKSDHLSLLLFRFGSSSIEFILFL